MSQEFRARVRALKLELVVLARAMRHERTPARAKLVVLLVVGYAASPIDLIPDPIPVLGLLDDLLLLPAGILLARRLVPDDVLAECRHSDGDVDTARAGRVIGAVVIAAWILAAALVAWRVLGDA